MRIHLLSDLHLEFEPFLPAKVDADVVVLAGDIHVKGRGIAWARAHFDCPVLYVLGNHEYYAGHLQRTLENMRAASDEHVRVLERDGVEIAGVRFLGTTLWTDFAAKGNPRLAALAAQQDMNDFRQVRTDNFRRIRPADLIETAQRSRAWLEAELAVPFTGQTVVITHHAPSLRSLVGNPHAGNLLDAAYANAWDDLLQGDQVALWVHGHSHNAVDYHVAGTRVVCNPRGYPGEDSGFNDRLVVTLEGGGTHESGNA